EPETALLARIDLGAEGQAVAVVPGTDSVVVGCGADLRLIDLLTHRIVQTFAGHTGDVTAVAVTPDGRRAVSASGDATLIVWDLAPGAAERRLEGHTNRVSAVAVMPDGRHAVSASRDETLIVWDLASGTAERRL